MFIFNNKEDYDKICWIQSWPFFWCEPAFTVYVVHPFIRERLEEKNTRRHAFDEEKSNIQEKRKENTLSTKQKKRKKDLNQEKKKD